MVPCVCRDDLSYKILVRVLSLGPMFTQVALPTCTFVLEQFIVECSILAVIPYTKFPQCIQRDHGPQNIDFKMKYKVATFGQW